MITIPIVVLSPEELRSLSLILLQASWTAEHDVCQLCKKLGKAAEQWEHHGSGAILLPKEKEGGL